MQFFKLTKASAEGIIPAMLLPALIFSKTLFSGFHISVIAAVFTGAAVSLGILIKRRFPFIPCFPVQLLVIGGLCSVVCAIMLNFKVINSVVALSAAFLSLYAVLRVDFNCGGEKGNNEVLFALKRVFNFALLLFVISHLREMFTSGYILSGFTPGQGIKVNVLQLGDYLNTLSGALLLISVAAFVLAAVFPGKINTEKALKASRSTYRIVLLSLVAAVLLLVPVYYLYRFLLVPFGIEYLTVLLLFTVSSFVYFIFGFLSETLGCDSSLGSYTAAFTLFILYFGFDTSSLLFTEQLIRIVCFGVLSMVGMYIFESACELLYSKRLGKRVRGTPAILMFSSISSLGIKLLIDLTK